MKLIKLENMNLIFLQYIRKGERINESIYSRGGEKWREGKESNRVMKESVKRNKEITREKKKQGNEGKKKGSREEVIKGGHRTKGQPPETKSSYRTE